MSESLYTANKIMKTPKTRNIAIMAAVIIILAIASIIYNLGGGAETPPGSLIVVMCDKCGENYIERVVDIADPIYACRKCGGKLGYAYKCSACAFEYCVKPFDVKAKPGHTMQLFDMKADMTKCPQCGNLAVGPVSIKKFKEKK